ncbi:MAG: Flp family type IVb pilin [Rhodospirillales bacterium]|nr:Flp family type IVb pilin [Rhodospirillales bacterium]
MTKTKKFLARLWSDESGISSVEYALLLAFIAAGVALAADQLGTAVEGEINGAATCVAGSDPATDCTF